MNLRKFLTSIAIVMAISTLFISSSSTAFAASKKKSSKASIVSATVPTSGDNENVSGEVSPEVKVEEEKLISGDTSYVSTETESAKESGETEKVDTSVNVSGDVVESDSKSEVSGELATTDKKEDASGEVTKVEENVAISGETVKTEELINESGELAKSGDLEVTVESGDAKTSSGEQVAISGDNKLVKDIDQDDWYFEYVIDAVDGKLMSTDSGDNFNPQDEATKEDLAKALYSLNEQKLAKEAKSTKTTKTTKTTKSSSKSKKEETKEVSALDWAVENKIMKSSEKGQDTISREEVASYLYSYAKNIEKKELSKKDKKKEVNFEDKEEISKNCSEAVLWCNINEIIIGRPDKTVGPKDLATRAETATMVVRLNELFNK